MKLRGNGLGLTMTLAVGAFAVGCGSSTTNSGTGGAGGAATDAAVDHPATGTGGAGTGGAGATDAGTDRPADVAADVAIDAGTDVAVDAGTDVPRPVCGPFADGGVPSDAGVSDAGSNASFFVTSNTSPNANLGGLAGADMRCQTLAASVGLGGKTWHAYLSTEHSVVDGGVGGPINARDRIGIGPWFNVRGIQVASNLTTLHTRKGDPLVFIDEHGNMINGQWTASPTPNEHDILTGSNADGTVALGKTCSDWTSMDGLPDGGVPDGGSADGGTLFVARIGHTDGFGGGCSTTPAPPNDVSSWNSAHDNAGCNDTLPRGGAGRLYCFAIN